MKLKHHPELLSGEVFIANTPDDQFRASHWKTKRQGRICYSRDGTPMLNYLDWSPMFAQRAELETAGIEMEDDV